MGIKWDKVFENEIKQFNNLSVTDKFIYFLLLQFGSPYGWGKENPESSDCSGAVCMALYAATGFLIRTTAHDLLKRVFTKPNPRTGDIRAAFYITTKAVKHGVSTVPVGTATHIAAFVDDGVVLNSQEPYARVRNINEVSNTFLRNGYEVLVRGLDHKALEQIAKEGKTKFDLDPEFGKYFS